MKFWSILYYNRSTNKNSYTKVVSRNKREDAAKHDYSNTNYGASNKRRSGVYEKHVENLRFVVHVAVLKIGDYQSVQLL